MSVLCDYSVTAHSLNSAPHVRSHYRVAYKHCVYTKRITLLHKCLCCITLAGTGITVAKLRVKGAVEHRPRLSVGDEVRLRQKISHTNITNYN
jgi:hypothetical protein